MVTSGNKLLVVNWVLVVQQNICRKMRPNKVKNKRKLGHNYKARMQKQYKHDDDAGAFQVVSSRNVLIGFQK